MAQEVPGLPEFFPIGRKRNSGSEQRRALDMVVFAFALTILLWSDFSKLCEILNSFAFHWLHLLKEGSLNVDLCPTVQNTC